MNGLRMLPFLFTSLISGVLSDRMDRRKLLLVTQVYLFVTTLAMGVLLLLGAAEVWHLFAFTLISGFGWSFTGPTQQGFGYCVFGRVTQGMDVVTKIAAVPTGNRGGHQNVPLEPVVIKSARVVSTQ